MAHLTHDIEFPPQQDPIRRRASRILHPSPLDFGGSRFPASTSNDQFSNPPLGSNGANQVNPRMFLLSSVFSCFIDDPYGSIWLRWFEPSCASFLDFIY
jgi:hypothetical protein